MTERKPADMSFRTWIEQQIDEATERGAFDNLPGAGKPLPRSDENAAEAWLREYVRREGVTTEEFLPVPLKLRKETERLAAAAPGLLSEGAVRAAAAELNKRIMRWRMIPVGPPLFVPLADEEAMVSAWRDAQAGPEAAVPAAGDEAGEGVPGGRAQRRWWQPHR